ncbi:ABC transporter transmembrane domain-containing protein [Actinokineospora bangkokensis]|uniref:ABC transporter n=1 Tax=Actinokineospora bangkokensis TaxID=1193682 RepID=A0A1Q9LLF4_9PSEU|nr:ABC transporter ATP-binding protein [Actinokineospora bangkokensis]OLR92824.1 ABC transporter [Actinokineospora bangkokensis]
MAYAPPTPRDHRSPARFLLWLVRSQWPRVLLGAALGSSWMVALAVPPYLLSRAIDDGLVPGDTGALVGWAAALLGTGVLTAALGISRHRTMTRIRMDASFRTVRAAVHHCAHLGATLPTRVAAGEVVAIGISDVQVIAQSLTVTGPGVGAVVAYLVVALVLLSTSPLLALVVLAGVPLLALAVGPLLRRIERAGARYREDQGALTNRLVDVLSGLRVLNGLGGKDFHLRRYREMSRGLVERGYAVGGPASWVTALATGLPALFLAAVVWLAARMAAQGQISAGDLVAVHGYVAVLVVPVAFFIEGTGDLARALVAAARVTRLLGIAPNHVDAPGARPAPPEGTLADPTTGAVIHPGVLTAVASTSPAGAIALVDRLGRFADTQATWSGTRVDSISSAELRDRVLVADNDAAFFPGTLRATLIARTPADDAALLSALRAAAAEDVLDSLAHGLDTHLPPGATTLSGGQRQRLRLARALHADPDVLLAVDPTSAVDATTESRIAHRLRAARRGRTTVVTTTSPLVLTQADHVVFLDDDRATPPTPHADLLRTNPAYRALVTRS